MNKPTISIIDFGLGNLLSVQRSFEHLNAKVTVTSDTKKILSASHIVLPGVGAFKNGITQLKLLGLDDTVKEIAAKQIPIMGICLGMQMMLDTSEEFELTRGLELISGDVISIPPLTRKGDLLRVPHIGWNSLIKNNEYTWESSPLKSLKEEEELYFVHSFMVRLKNSSHNIATCNYGGHLITSFIQKENVYGCQFHPEKSGKVGLNILKDFLSL